jgi:hypothetical protein
MSIINIKKIAILASFIMLLSSFGGSNRNYQTECVSTDMEGYLTIKIWDTKKGEKYKSERARKDAIHAVLFSGVAGSNGCTTQAPMLNKDESQYKFSLIEKKFFARGGKWSTFTRTATITKTIPDSLGPKKWKVYQVTVLKKELRNYLEENKILNNLNNGF